MLIAQNYSTPNKPVDQNAMHCWFIILSYLQTRRSNMNSSPLSSSSSLRRKMSGGSISENNGYKKSEKVTRQRSSTTPSSTNTGDGKLDYK